MAKWLIRLLLALRSVLETRASREAEILVLRRQLLVLSRKAGKRVRLRNIDEAPRHLIRDRDGAFGPAYIRRVRAMGIRDHPVAARSPWQNGHVERLIGSIRRECLDHLVVSGEAHLRQVLKTYAAYYNEVRTHLSLDKDAPKFRRSQRFGRIVAMPVLGGLHHQYVRV